ncbi:MAG TPA: PAS domain S-box protein [Acidimicrobiales bacterium]|nr:PAS domain S-box protein [Acidimicrobiales bacterium]
MEGEGPSTSRPEPPGRPPPTSADHLRLLVDSLVNYGIITTDPDGRVLSWNAGAERCTGHRADEVGGRHVSLVYPEDEVRSGRPDQQLAVAVAEGHVASEGWRVRKDGRAFWASEVITALRGPDGRLRGFGVVLGDLTDRRRAEQLLQENEERLRLYVDSVTDYAMFILDPEGRVASWNPGAERLKGYRADEIIGRHFSTFYPEEDIRSGKPRRELEVAAARGRVEDEGWRIRKDGSRFWANVVISALRTPTGELRGFGKVTRDLTERKRAEDALKGALQRERETAARLRELDQMKNEFVAIVAHDLRSPLAVISGFTDLLLEGELEPDQQREALRAIGRSVPSLVALVDDVLEVARIESGEMHYERAQCNVREIVEGAVQDNRPAGRPGDIVVSVEDDLPMAFADPRRVWQVVSNLLSNAIKFSPPEAVIDVQVRSEPGAILVSVVDRGDGIAPEHLPKLFERFSRLPRPAGEMNRGSGLGLYISRSLVEAQGGRIWAESVVGEGSTFSFTIPNSEE